ncbi:PAS domain S-box protein [Hyalangium rubrum]|uniref:histidine kinase n=1 Tax=Hyalangium rubrum TaxID=3103134 RepID=A0ABU5H2W3_9BACT|nr:PAS domain S-box protein [Hyalangium sp. s54d21]MDY7227811.1 PAS domain S-box protein [Hyalangium sp. s54d21]
MTDEKRALAPSGNAPEVHTQNNPCSVDPSRLLVESVRDYAIFMLDPQGRIASWNLGAERINGYRAEEVLGKHFSLFCPPEEVVSGRCERALELALAEGRFEEEGWRVRKDGVLYWANVIITPIREHSGQLVGFSTVARDLTERRKAEEQLRESEQRFRLLLGSIRDYVIFMLDTEGRVSTWNAVAEHTKGYRAEEIIGQHFSRFYTPEDRLAGRPQRLLRQAVEQGRVEDEGWRLRKDGTRFWADVIISAVRDASGTLRGFSKVTRDLTERRRAQEQLRVSEERFRLLISGVKDYAIFMLDPRGYVVTWNEGAERINGYRAEEIIGQRFTRFYPEEEILAGKCDRELEVALREGRFEEEGWRLRKDGTRFWASVVITAIHDSAGRHSGFAKVTRDLTERRKLEEERVRVAQAQEALRLRDEFLSIASHELKTPLTALQLQLHSLRDRVEALDARVVSKVDRAARSSERLSALIEALLDVSRIATGRFELNPQRFDLSEAVREAGERLREAATQAGCELLVKVPESLSGKWDRLRVEQVLTNLLSNAIKYAANAPIEVSLVQEEDTAVLEVSDRGPGIPEADLSRIFERFERAAEVRHYGGLGLGLYVVREIVKAHDGMVTAHNRPGGGACFTIRLPLAPSERAQEEPPKPGALH